MSSILLKIIKTSAPVIALAFVMVFSNCGGGDPEPEPKSKAEEVTEILTSGGSTWTPAPASGGAVLIDGVDVTDELFPGFTITFGDGTLTTTGTTPVWLRQDTWRFKDENATVIIRGQDNREVTIEEISSTQLKLTLDWPETTSGGRSTSLKGKHEFYLKK